MTQLAGIRLVQLGIRSLGADPGAIDGWWGDRTQRAVEQLLSVRGGPIGTQWAFDVLQRGLDDLGWYTGPLDGQWSAGLMAALANLLRADGVPKASAVDLIDLAKVPPASVGMPVNFPKHGNTIRQGRAGYVVDTLYLHTTATPGSWVQGKTNQQMFDEVKRWHTGPKSQGGRAWSDIGYQGLIFPDGEEIAGRALTTIGAGVLGHNAGSVHYAMVPVKTITRMGRPEDFYTPATIAAAKRRIELIAQQTPLKRLRGHNEDAAKLCPGFVVVDSEWTSRPVT